MNCASPNASSSGVCRTLNSFNRYFGVSVVWVMRGDPFWFVICWYGNVLWYYFVRRYPVCLGFNMCILFQSVTLFIFFPIFVKSVIVE